MKKFIVILAVPACIYSFNGCRPKDDSTGTAAATDTSLMADGPADVAKSNAAAASIDTAATGKPDPSKKGKKGKVSMVIGEPKAAGSTEEMDKEGYYTNVYPAYPGGDKALSAFFEKNIQYPQDASDNGVDGTVKISFTVDEKGKIGAPKVVSPKIGYGLEEEALRVFNKMPSWTPGSLKGKNVKTRYTLPVRFQLEG